LVWGRPEGAVAHPDTTQALEHTSSCHWRYQRPVSVIAERHLQHVVRKQPSHKR
jgi:hypothetical protein